MRKNSGSSLFLMELILAILFFSLASTACVQMFVKSHLLSEKSKDLTQCIMQTQSLTECFYSTNGDLAQIAELFPDSSTLSEQSITLYYDQDWNSTSASASAYQTRLTINSVDQRSSGKMIEATIRSTSGDQASDSIYALTISKFIPEVIGHEN